MFKHILPLIALLTFFDSNAQSFKTDALQQRLIAYRKNSYSNGSLFAVDSNTFTYSGSRGSVNTANVVYDVRQRWTLSAGNIVPDYRRTRSWSANGLNADYLDEDYAGGSFENNTRTLYSYDGNGNRIRSLNQSWNGATWDSTSKTDFVYDADNQLLSETVSLFTGGAWEVSYRFSYTYDANSFLTEELYQENLGSGLVNSFHHIYTNNAAGKVLVELVQNWISNAWENDTRFTFTYDLQNQETGFVLERWTAGAWVKEDKAEYTYHASGYFLSSIQFSWSGSNWDTTSKQYFSYNGLVLIEDSTWIFTGGNAEKYARTTYTRDANGNADTVTFYKWANNSWENDLRTDYDYNLTYNNLDRLIKESWNGSQWQRIEENYYYYEEYNAPSGIETVIEEIPMAVYPNPVSSVLNIDFKSTKAEETEIRVVNLNGQEVLRTSTQSVIGDNYLTLKFDLLTVGLYIVELKQNGQYSYRKISKQ